MGEVKSKKRAIITINYVVVGDSVDEVYLEKQRPIKLLNSLKDTTPKITDVQCVIKLTAAKMNVICLVTAWPVSESINCNTRRGKQIRKYPLSSQMIT